MNKRDFIKSAGLLGLASVLPIRKTRAMLPVTHGGGCVLIPSETAGPFPLDLSENDFYFRQDVREDEPGVQLNLRIKVIGLDDCLPMQNTRVNIWHCDNIGNYSGYGTETGLTYLRGYQFSDVNGEVEFITIFPGWYPGRVCHIHFQVYVSSQYAAISQLGFPQEEKQALYNAHPDLYPDGPDPLTLGQDGVFADGYEYQVTTLTPNEETGGYDAYLEVTVQGSGTTGMGYLERQGATLFSLGQNFPNPCAGHTSIPLLLHAAAKVELDLWSLQGKKLATILESPLDPGQHTLAVDFDQWGLAAQSLVYRCVVHHASGIFYDCKVISHL